MIDSESAMRYAQAVVSSLQKTDFKRQYLDIAKSENLAALDPKTREIIENERGEVIKKTYNIDGVDIKVVGFITETQAGLFLYNLRKNEKFAKALENHRLQTKKLEELKSAIFDMAFVTGCSRKLKKLYPQWSHFLPEEKSTNVKAIYAKRVEEIQKTIYEIETA